MAQKAVEKGIGRLPQLKGYIFPQDVSIRVNQVLGERANEWLKMASDASGAIRTATATLDFSPLTITSAGVFGRNPVAWAHGMSGFIKALRDPNALYDYGVANKDVVTNIIQHGGSAEIGDMFAGQGVISKVIGGKVSAATFGRLQNATRMLTLVSKVELYKAGIADMTAKGLVGEAADAFMSKMVRSIELMTGNFSSKAMGIPINNRLFESAFGFFSPSYTRAALSLMGDVVRGDIAGAEARKTIAGMMLGGATMYNATALAMGQEPEWNPASSKFMTIAVGNRRLGIGGIYTAMMRFMGESAMDVSQGIGEMQQNKPLEGFGKLNPLNISRLDNPFYRFMYGRAAPLTGTINETIFEKKNYLGQPFESWQDYAWYMAGKVVPLSVSAVFPDQTKPYMGDVNQLGVFAANVAGLRESPKSPSEMRDEARDTVAVNKFSVQYEDLNRAQKKEVDSNPQIDMLITEAEKIIERRGGKEALAFLHYNNELDSIREQRDDMIGQAATAASQSRDYEWFKDIVSEIEGQYINNYKYISGKPDYSPVMESYKDPNRRTPLSPLDVAYAEWADVMYGGRKTQFGEMANKFGEPDYINQNKFIQYFIQKYGQEALQYVQEDRVIAGRDLPELYLELRQARQALKPYWAVQTNYEETFGAPTTKSQFNRMNATVSKIRKKMLTANPQLNAYYSKFYRKKGF